jgi:hypothetical protein
MRILYLTLMLVSMSAFSQNIIIGDSQVPFIDTQTSKAERAPGLWKGGIGISDLTKMVNNYPITPSIQNVVISIGTNNRFQGGVVELFQALKRKFPKAKFYAVQGSWGWGGVRSISKSTVYRYYLQFQTQGAVIIEPAIGPGDPHRQKASYNLIGKSLDKIL